MAEIEDAAKKAFAHEFITSFKVGVVGGFRPSINLLALKPRTVLVSRSTRNEQASRYMWLEIMVVPLTLIVHYLALTVFSGGVLRGNDALQIIRE